MRFLLPLIAILFAGVLSQAGGIAAARAEGKQDGFNSSCWTNVQYPVSAGLHRPANGMGNPAETPASKDHFSTAALVLRKPEAFLTGFPDYLACSVEIYIGLPVSTIIFPFHYFW